MLVIKIRYSVAGRWTEAPSNLLDYYFGTIDPVVIKERIESERQGRIMSFDRVQFKAFGKAPNYRSMKPEEVARDKNGRSYWRRESLLGMNSAIGEYSNVDELAALMDYIDELESELKKYKK